MISIRMINNQISIFSRQIKKSTNSIIKTQKNIMTISAHHQVSKTSANIIK